MNSREEAAEVYNKAALEYIRLFINAKDLLTSDQVNKVIDIFIKQEQDLSYLERYMTPEQKEILQRRLDEIYNPQKRLKKKKKRGYAEQGGILCH